MWAIPWHHPDSKPALDARDNVWRRAMRIEAADSWQTFVGALIPPYAFPAEPQYWTWERDLEMPSEAVGLSAWPAPGWTAYGMLLVPQAGQRSARGTAVFVVCRKEGTLPGSAQDAPPRLFHLATRFEGQACTPRFSTVAAGFEWMSGVVEREPYVYTQVERRQAAKTGTRLPPYSMVHLRKDAADDDGVVPSSDEHGGAHWTCRWAQRGHLRKLHAPRKSDGLRVVRVRAGIKGPRGLPLRLSPRVSVVDR